MTKKPGGLFPGQVYLQLEPPGVVKPASTGVPRPAPMPAEGDPESLRLRISIRRGAGPLIVYLLLGDPI